MTKRTREQWAERVRQWRASGKSAEDFTADKNYAASSLRWAAAQVKAEQAPTTPARTSSAPAPRAPRFVRVRTRRSKPTTAEAEVVVEIGGAKIRVTRGADVALVGDVVRALQGVGG